jgi:hypothetical protein
MEVLIPILFFFIIFFVVLFKILNGIRKFLFSKEGREGKTATWKDFLKDLADQVQQQMEAQKPETEEGRSAWERLMGREIDEEPIEAVPVPPPPPKPKRSRESAPRPAPSPIAKTAVGKEKTKAVSAPPGLKPGKTTPSAEELRNAVIWSEILGKPVGLREEEI